MGLRGTMTHRSRISFCLSLCLLAALAFGQAPTNDGIDANQNRTPAGKLENSVLTVQLELRAGTWHAEAEDGPPLYVQAFGEVGHPAQIPGPLLRMPEGTIAHVTLTNKLKMKATVYGLNTRPGDAKAGIELEPGASRELTFAAGAPGTYFYWARTVTKNEKEPPYLADAQLNGAFIVDPPGAVSADRVFVIDAMFVPADAVHKTFEVVTINGKSYPYTEPLEYMQGESIRWRVINPSASEHPMHLHGAFYQVLSLGDFEAETVYAPPDRQWVVTENIPEAHTMMMEWKPPHAGRWLFHCHFAQHISSEERVPRLVTASMSSDSAEGGQQGHDHHDTMTGMNDMAGLVLVINVKSASGSDAMQTANPAVHKIDLVIEPTAASGKMPTFSCSVREGKKIVASQEKAMGPPIVVRRGEPTEVTVLNHLSEPTTIHWHGLELDSYYDGVIGGGTKNQVTPPIAPGGSFTARFTPNRAGTFIYHTHAANTDQLAGGIYGALIVLEPGEQFDPEHDRVLVLGTRDADFNAKRLTLNGAEQPSPLVFKHGEKYRLRLINMGADLAGDVELGSKDHAATWRAIAKDGAMLPPRLVTTSDAKLHFASGEVYDFEFQPNTPGEMALQVENEVGHAKVVAKVVVE